MAEKLKKKVQVITLPAEKERFHEAPLLKELSKFKKELEQWEYSKSGSYSKEWYNPYHMYFLSQDEGIKKGDHVILNDKAVKVGLVDDLGFEVMDKFTCWYVHKVHTGLKGKIIATTNPNLWLVAIELAPKTSEKIWHPTIAKIPTDFLEAWVKAEGKISEVLVKYRLGKLKDQYKEDQEALNKKHFPNPYILSEENYHWFDLILDLNNSGAVKVYPIQEKLYTREEVINMLASYSLNRTQDPETNQYDFPNLFNSKREEAIQWMKDFYPQ